MERWTSADGEYYEQPRFDGRLRLALVSDEVLADDYEPEWPPSRDDVRMPYHLARQLRWGFRGNAIETMEFLAAELNELFEGFPVDTDTLASTLSEAALKATSASDLVDLVLTGPSGLRTAEMPPGMKRYDNLAKHTRPLVQRVLRSQLRAMFERWNGIDFTVVSERLSPSYRAEVAAGPVVNLTGAQRRKDREGMNFTPPYR